MPAWSIIFLGVGQNKHNNDGNFICSIAACHMDNIISQNTDHIDYLNIYMTNDERKPVN